MKSLRWKYFFWNHCCWRIDIGKPSNIGPGQSKQKSKKEYVFTAIFKVLGTIWSIWIFQNSPSILYLKDTLPFTIYERQHKALLFVVYNTHILRGFRSQSKAKKPSNYIVVYVLYTTYPFGNVPCQAIGILLLYIFTLQKPYSLM